LLFLELLVFPPQIVNFLEQFAPGQNAVREVGGQLLGGAGQPKQGQKPAADREF
jgi:hypothetical protein